jgi:PAS domain S-box-containing protein
MSRIDVAKSAGMAGEDEPGETREVVTAESARQEAALRARARQQAAVAALGQRALAGASIDALKTEAVEAVARELDVEYAKVLELTPDGGSLLLRAGVGWAPGLVGRASVSAGTESQAGFTLAERRPVIVADLGAETRFSGPALLVDHGVVSGLSVIISGTGPPFGVLGAHTRRRRSFTGDDVSFVQSVANVLAAAVHRERADRALRESETLFRQLAESIRGVVWMTDASKSRLLYVSRRYEEIWGRSVESLYAAPRSWLDAIHPEDRARVAEAAGAKQVSGEYDEVYRIVRPDGSERWIQDRAFPIRGIDGEVRRIAGIAEDITARKEAEAALARSERRSRALLENAQDMVSVVGEDGLILYSSPALERVLGYRPEERVGRSGFEIVHPDDIQAAFEALSRILASPGATGRLSYRCRHKDGSWRVLEGNGQNLLHDPDVRGIIINSRDVTERVRLEEQVRQAQKMEAVGRLAGGVAHDFNNMLTAITGFVNLALDGLHAYDPIRSDLEEVEKVAQRAASLTGQLLAFGRKQVLSPAALDLNAVVAGTERMLRRLIGEDIRLVWTPAPDLGQVMADPGQVAQVIMNLAVNARDAMPRGGTLAIATADVVLDAASVAGDPDVAPGPYVRISVSDTGCGMDAEVLSHLFEPFFTTKGAGRGTGLGLSTVYGIVKQSGGHITVQSEVGRGTRFDVYLPRLAAAEGRSPAPRPSQERVRGTETILVAEDDEIVRRLTRRALETYGYKVLLAASSEEALAACERHEGPIALLLTDVVMPGLSGRDLADRVVGRRPATRVLYVSGYTAGIIASHGVLDPEMELLEKPFTPEGLLRKVREVLDAPSRPA